MEDCKEKKIGVIGAGSWGTALANLLGHKGFKTDIWVYEANIRDEILSFGENKTFLPGVTLSANVVPTCDIETAATDKDVLVFVVPSHVMRVTAKKVDQLISKETVIISASKGIENTTHLSMTGVLKEVLPTISPSRFAVLSGPSFAREVAKKSPTAVSVACKDPSVSRYVQHVFATPYFRVYTNDDVIGVEFGGAVKNVIAIAAGVIDGLGLGLNTRAALITRGQAEIRRMGLKLSANPRTFTGLAGIGDLILTCTGNLSRNYKVGEKIGQGMKLKEILSDMDMVAEGVKTAKSVYNLSHKRGIDMPICRAIYHVLFDDLSPQTAVHMLMTRDLRHELDDY